MFLLQIYFKEDFIMNKTELVGAVADKAGISVASAEKAVKALQG